MEAEKVMDSVKDWLRNRLDNPYFASVFVVWLFTNRIEVFGLFNFKDDQSVQERLLWMQERFQNKEVFGIHMGFEGVVIFSLIMGLVTMLGFKYAKVCSGIIYTYFGKGADYIHRLKNEDKWQPIKDFEDLKMSHIKELELLDKARINLVNRNQEKDVELIELKEGKAVALKSIIDLKTDIVKIQKEKNDLDFDSNLLTTIKEQNSIYLSGIEKLKTDTAQIKAQNEALISRNIELEGTLKKNKEGDDWNEKDKKQKEKNLQLFLESPFLEYFDEIMGLIRNHKIINDSFPTSILEYYVANRIIVMNGNLFVMTEKGNEYYISYLKTKKHNISIPPESNFKGVKGGGR